MMKMMNPKEDSKGEGIDPPVLFLGVPDPEESLEGWVQVRSKGSTPRPAKKTQGLAKKVEKEMAKVRKIT